MAQWGTGDPRWIVDERSDGRNVNGWHWEEKCILQQVKQRLADAFINVTVDTQGAPGQIHLTGCRDITGEASIATRKAKKRICVYDLKMTVDWEVTVVPSNKAVKGTMRVDEFASASEADDYMFDISTTGTGPEVEAAKALVQLHGKPEVVRRLVALAKELQDV